MSGPAQTALSLADASAQISHLLAVGQVRRARELAADLVGRQPDDPGAHVVLSEVLLALGEKDAAQAAADEALRLDPESPVTVEQQARVLFQRGRFAGAEIALLHAVALSPDDPDLHLLYARLLFACGRPALGLAAVGRALELDPDEPVAHSLRAILLLATRPRDWNISAGSALRAVRLAPDDANAQAVLGAVRLHGGQVAEAEQCFRAALGRSPGNRLALRGLAEVVMARQPAYRPLLAYSLFMARSTPGMRLAVVAGSWAVVSALLSVLADGLLEQAIRYSWMAFCLYTWLAEPVTRGILARHHPWLRQA